MASNPQTMEGLSNKQPPTFYSYSSQAFVDHHGICRYIIAIYSSHLVYSTNANMYSSHKNQFLLWKMAMEDSPGAPCLAGFRVITRAPRCANVKMFGELVGDGWRMFGKCCEKLYNSLSLSNCFMDFFNPVFFKCWWNQMPLDHAELAVAPLHLRASFAAEVNVKSPTFSAPNRSHLSSVEGWGTPKAAPKLGNRPWDHGSWTTSASFSKHGSRGSPSAMCWELDPQVSTWAWVKRSNAEEKNSWLEIHGNTFQD